jgi:ABC-2 type transport system ATP-binding protein
MTLTPLDSPPEAGAEPAGGAGTAGAEPAIVVRGLHKRYREVEAVRGLDLEVPPGEFFAFLGPNGAGKSTTIKILCTLLQPSAGEVRVAGHDVLAERGEVRRRIGLVFQETTLDDYLTAEQNLRFHAEIYGMPRRSIPDRLDAVFELVALTARRGDRVRTFSGGMKRRLEIARGLLHSPRVLFLDEPTVGLDPESRSTLWRYVDELRRREQITIFLTTHYMDEAERCDRIAIVDAGRIVALDTPSALKATVGRDRVEVRSADDDALAAGLRERFGLAAGREDGAVVVAVPDGEAFVPRLFELGVAVRSVKVARPSLDDVFLAFTGSRMRDADARAERAGRFRRAGRFGRAAAGIGGAGPGFPGPRRRPR